MANFAPLCTILSIILMSSFSSGYGSHSYVGGDGEMNTNPNIKTWCVAKSRTSDSVLQANIEFACSTEDCTPIQYGGQCFIPNTLLNHASFAMNSFYQHNGKIDIACSFNKSGHVVVKDPSYGSCTFVS